MIKTIVFDFGGVLGTDADTIFYDVLEKYGIDRKTSFALFSEYWPRLADGKKSADYFLEYLKKKINKDIKNIKEEYEDSIRIYPEVLAIAQLLKEKNFQMGILANESKEWMNIKIKKGKLDEIFDVILSSADIGVRKPDKKAFEIILKALSAKSKETLFIDNLEKNIETAKKLGIKTILFTSAAQLKKEIDFLLKS